jgi:Protein of unknown function (DUF3800)
MRLTYVDEGGIAKHEGFMVVSGAIIDGDRQLVAIENHLDILVQKHIPEEDRPGFIFHATEIWSGGGYFKDRNKWPRDRRLLILQDLSKIPKHFDVPIAWGHVDKSKFPDPKFACLFSTAEIDVATHVMAFTECSLVTEMFMRECTTNEITVMIAEDRDVVRRAVKEAHAMYRNPAEIKKYGLDKNRLLPFRHIRDTVHWAKKEESRHLQLADACTFFIKGHLNKNVLGEQFYSELRPMLLVFPSAEGSAAQSA